MNKGILFSTRYIGRPNTIFEHIKPLVNNKDENIFSPLRRYFLTTNKDELDKLKKRHIEDKEPEDETTKSSTSKDTILSELKNTKEEIKSSAKHKGFWKGEVISYDQSDDWDSVMSVLEDNNDEELNKLIKSYESLRSNLDSNIIGGDLIFKDSDFFDYLDVQKDLNFDGYSSQRIRDRLSLYKLDNHGNTTCDIFAVWSLGKPDNDKYIVKNDERLHISEWINALVDSVLELDDNLSSLILILHDKDFAERKQYVRLQSLYNEKVFTREINGKTRTIKLSVAVFQHPDDIFKKLIKSSNYHNTTSLNDELYKEVMNIIKNSRIFDNLLDISDVISKDDNNKLTNNLSTLLGDEWNSKEYDELRYGLELYNDGLSNVLPEISSSVNERISNSVLFDSLCANTFDAKRFVECVKILDAQPSAISKWQEIRRILLPVIAFSKGKANLKKYITTLINEQLKKIQK